MDESIFERLDRATKERDEARADLEKAVEYNTKLQEERDEARAEVERLKTINQEVLKANYTMGTTRPEPSRLEIAATLVASRFSGTLYVTEVKGTWIKYALEGADALIAAAKEGK